MNNQSLTPEHSSEGVTTAAEYAAKQYQRVAQVMLALRQLQNSQSNSQT